MSAVRYWLTLVLCSTSRATRPAYDFEVILDESDGLDWQTLCRCDLVFLAPKAAINNRRGHLTEERRRQILRTMLQSNDWIL